MAVVDLRLDPTARELRWFAPLLLLFFGLAGSITHWGFEARAVALVLWGAGILVALVYTVVPVWRLAIYRGWVRLTYPIGWVVSHIVLAGVYYLVITPIGLVSRMMRRDPLTRQFDRGAETYWVGRDAARETDRYFNQF